MPETNEIPASDKRRKSPWVWLPSLYFAEGLPFVVISTLSVIMYKSLDVSLADIAFYTSWLYLPWVIKPLWSPLVEIFRTKRFWIIAMQLVMGAGFALVAFSIPLPCFFQVSIAFFWLLAFNSATHDIAADGFYMLALNTHDQAWFVGIRSIFYRLAMIAGQGLLVMLAGLIETHTGVEPLELKVSAVKAETVQEQAWLEPENLPAVQADDDAPLKIVSIPGESLIIPMGTPSQEAVSALMAKAKKWNKKEEKILANAEKPAESIWAKQVRKPLENWIRKTAGSELREKTQKTPGNMGVVYLRLSKPPAEGKTVSVQFGRKGGSKSVALLEEGRVEFNSSNWQHPYMALIQLDPKLKETATASFEARAGKAKLAWSISFALLAVLFIILGTWHFFSLPHPSVDTTHPSASWLREFGDVFATFFSKKGIWAAMTFLLLYRLGEAQLVKVAAPFLLDAQENGGLACSTAQVGFTYGTLGVTMLIIGGLCGGWAAARFGLRACLWWMALAINLPDILYVYLAVSQPAGYAYLNLCVAVEQLGYGFGFTAYMLFMIYFAEGRYKTAHYAIMTGFMALGMMMPGMFSGWLQEIIGYPKFFVWVIIATLPGFLTLAFLKIDSEFGKKQSS